MSERLMVIQFNCQRMPLVPDAQGADVERSPEPKSSRLAQAP